MKEKGRLCLELEFRYCRYAHTYQNCVETVPVNSVQPLSKLGGAEQGEGGRGCDV